MKLEVVFEKNMEPEYYLDDLKWDGGMAIEICYDSDKRLIGQQQA